MKKVLGILIMLLCVPSFVFASVACNDGSIDTTCDVCSSDCCIGHDSCGNIKENNNDECNDKVDNAKICYFVFGVVSGILGTCAYIYFTRKK